MECVKPGNDNVERNIDHKIKNTIVLKGLDVVRQYATLLEIRVRKAQAVNRQTKHIGNLLPQCASDATGFLSDVYKKSTRAQKFLADGVQCGRSMIEMLGVLAIIAVLSVGGIAGYGKAMEKFKITKAVGDYAILIQGLVEHLSDFRKLNAGGNVYGIAEPVQALGLVPDNWIIIQKRDEHQPTFSDAYGNYSSVFSRYNRVVFSIAIGGQNNTNGVTTTPAFSTKFCEEILTNVFAPLHSFIVFAGVWRSGNDNNDHTNSWYGDKYCGSEYRRCLTSITPIQINEVCKKCEGKTEQCSVTVEME